MKNIVIFFLIIFVFITTNIPAKEIIKLSNGEWPPLTSKNLKNFGVFSRIVSEAFKLEGITVEYGWFPWKRAFYIAKIGKYHGTVAWVKTAERKKDFYYSDIVMTTEFVFFHLKNFNFKWNKIDDLKKYKIVVTRGYAVGAEFDKAVKNKLLKVTYINDDLEGIKLLRSNRIDLFPNEINVGYYLIRKYFPENANLFIHNPRPTRKARLHVLFPKKDLFGKTKYLLKKFNKGLSKLKQSSKYKQYILESRRGEYILN